MRIVHTLSELRQVLASSPQPSFVPTMGHLHDGHLALLSTARQYPGPVVCSIFVNRLQFAPHEDFDRYPRTLERDAHLLDRVGCDVVFAPAEAELYPTAQTLTVQPDPQLAHQLEGEFRPGFFTGVCTVVLKLFHCVQPHTALFGQKDYQQWRVIQHLVQQLALPIDIVGVPTCRLPSGLALSSRNTYLSAAEQTQAAALHTQLCHVRDAIHAGHHDVHGLCATAAQALTRQGWKIDYLSVRERNTLQVPTAHTPLTGHTVVLAAAHLGRTRLIDNLEI